MIARWPHNKQQCEKLATWEAHRSGGMLGYWDCAFLCGSHQLVFLNPGGKGGRYFRFSHCTGLESIQPRAHWATDTTCRIRRDLQDAQKKPTSSLLSKTRLPFLPFSPNPPRESAARYYIRIRDRDGNMGYVCYRGLKTILSRVRPKPCFGIIFCRIFEQNILPKPNSVEFELMVGTIRYSAILLMAE